LSSAENYLIGCNVLEHLFQRGVVASRLANMGEGRPQKNSANLQSFEQPKRSQSEAADI
jgi:hypothetical protein